MHESALERMLDNEYGQVMRNLEQAAVTDAKFSLPQDVKLNCLSCIAKPNEDFQVDVNCFERIPRHKHDNGPAALAHYDLRYTILLALKATRDPRA